MERSLKPVMNKKISFEYFTYGRGLKILFFAPLALYFILVLVQGIVGTQMISVVHQASGLYESPKYNVLIDEYYKSIKALNLSDNFYYGFILPGIAYTAMALGYISLFLILLAIIIFIYQKTKNEK